MKYGYLWVWKNRTHSLFLNKPLHRYLEQHGKLLRHLLAYRTPVMLDIADDFDTPTFLSSCSASLEPAATWPEPKVPADFKAALSAVSPASSVWIDITPAARWDWIRWIDATRTPETRKRRIATAYSMLTVGKRRPCCFNRNQCTETSVSNNGVLLDRLGTVGKKR